MVRREELLLSSTGGPTPHILELGVAVKQGLYCIGPQCDDEPVLLELLTDMGPARGHRVEQRGLALLRSLPVPLL